MKLPNLLATRKGRLAAFFLLYITEGIPLGFAADAVAFHLGKEGVGPAAVGEFVASIYVPWAIKWAFGPFIDTIKFKHWGHRRAWIIGTQLMMVLTLLAMIPIPLPSQLGLFTAVLFLHNTFGAMQDVAIDALACNTLTVGERGLANGLMFAGAGLGQAFGGGTVLKLMAYTGFQGSFILVCVLLLSVTLLVALPMKEAVILGLQQHDSRGAEAKPAPAVNALPSNSTVDGHGEKPEAPFSWGKALEEMRVFSIDSFRSFLGTRRALFGVFVAIGPAGAMALGLALQTNLSVEFGMNADERGNLSLISNAVGSVFMILGGWLSDKFGRLRTLSLYLALMSLPVFYLAWQLQQAGYVMPRPPGQAPMEGLKQLLWVTTMAYYIAQGLMYGTRIAIFMDVTNPKVAATQFTAYMAMMNLAIATAATWQGAAVEAFGYPITLLADGILGWVFIVLLYWMQKPEGELANATTDGNPANRARAISLVLGLCCLLWLPAWHWRTSLGPAQPLITGTFFTLIFVISALFILAGREVLGNETPAWWRKAAPWVALWLMLMYARGYLGKEATSTLYAPLQALCYLGPLVGAGMLFALARQGWGALHQDEKSATAPVTGKPAAA